MKDGMIKLEDVRKAADLAIELGFTLADFRRNMDEWEEDEGEVHREDRLKGNCENTREDDIDHDAGY